MSATVADVAAPEQRDLKSACVTIGLWHQQPGSPLDAALAHIADACPGRLPLARFLLLRLPRALLCSNSLKTADARSRYMPVNRAVRRK